jgi:hypothetical protein
MTHVLRALTLSVVALAASCSDFHAKEQEGGETHFLRECLWGACPEGLSCICGVCTIACEDDDTCTGLGERAACRDTESKSLSCEGESPTLQICDATCSSDEQCGALGADYRCIENRCRAKSIDEDRSKADPLVMIVLDTSASMERKAGCECTTFSCIECLPACGTEGSEKNRWAHALEALTGTFEDFSCEAKTRDDEGAYDFAYSIPYHQPTGAQQADGIVRTYADRVRFGVATFDGIASYDRDASQLAPDEFSFSRSAGQDGLWSYPAVESIEELEVGPHGFQAGLYRYPGSPHPYLMNTGIRGRDAESGALTIAERRGADEAAVDRIEQTLRAIRPFGTAPIAAALDDVRWLFEKDPALASERMHAEREHHLILITDGEPDDDYRLLGCGCFDDGNADDCGDGLLEVPAEMTCPYPSPSQAARQLRCGVSQECEGGAFDSVHLIGWAEGGLSWADGGEPGTAQLVEAMAIAGGGTSRIVEDGAELRSALAAVLDSIVDGSYRGEVTAPGPSEIRERRTCMAGELMYADGASWPQGCNRCNCANGEISCTMAGCTPCVDRTDCTGSQVCHIGPDCTTGLCGPPSPTCDAPLNARSLCTCNGESTAPTDCSALIQGVVHVGACE